MNKQLYSDLETLKHIEKVRDNISILVKELLERAEEHDKSKLESPEKEIFAEHAEELEKTEYGTEEYNKLLEKVKPAIEHHYSVNRHHPQYHKNGIEDMCLLDICEMLVDWLVSSTRNKYGNIRKSIDINAERFNICPQLKAILENTIKRYF